MSACLEDRTQRLGVVGHHTIHAEIEKATDLPRIIDRPHMYVKSLAMRSRDETGRHHDKRTAANGHLHHLDAAHREGKTPTRTQGGSNLGGPCSGAESWAHQSLQPASAAAAERGDAHALDGPHPVEDVGQRSHRGIVFRIEVEPCVGEHCEEVVEAADLVDSRNLRPTHLRPGQFRHDALAVGDAPEDVIVKRHRHTVAGHMDISFEMGESEVDSVTKCPLRVFGMDTRSPSVGEADRAVAGEVWVWHARDPTSQLLGSDYGGRMEPADQLAELLADPNGSLPLDRALLLLAAARPGHTASVESGMAALDELASGCADPTVTGLTRHLFHEEGFSGDHTDYHDPRNSLLDEVLSRRIGMPITLGVVLLETGRRLGVGLDGIGMPGHFLVRDRVLTEVFVDPYHDGAQINEDQCLARFRSIHGPDATFDPRFLEPIDSRAIVGRILNNLTASFRGRSPRDLDWVLDLRVQLPAPPPDQRALAQLCEGRGRYEDAADLLEQLALSTGSEAAAERAFLLRARLN